MPEPSYPGVNVKLGYLKVLNGTLAGNLYLLPEDLATIGRGGECDIKIDDQACSRIQCRIIRDGSQYLLRDVESHNGTLVGEIRVETVILNDGDIIRLGKTKLQFGLCQAIPYERPGEVECVTDVATDDLNSTAQCEATDSDGAPDREFMATVADLMLQEVHPRLMLIQFLDAISRWLNVENCCAFVGNHGKFDLSSVVFSRSRNADGPSVEFSRTIVDKVIANEQAASESFLICRKEYSVVPTHAFCVPLMIAGQVFAIIYVDSKTQDVSNALKFCQSRFRCLTSVSRLVSESISRQLSIGSAEKINYQIQICQVLSLASHRISNRLQVINNGSFLIDTGIHSNDEELVERGWEMMRQNQSMISNLVKNLISVCRDFEPVQKKEDVCKLVEESINNISDGFDINYIDLVHCNPNQSYATLEQYTTIQALENLLCIALSESRQGRTQFPIRVTTSAACEWIEVNISFQQFSDSFDLCGIMSGHANKANAENDLLAAMVAKRQIEIQGGRIKAKVDPNGNNQLVLQLPIRPFQDGSATTDASSSG